MSHDHSMTYNYALVALSYLISVFGSFTALQICSNFKDGGANLKSIFGAAFALGGGGIWTMHFIGMLAMQSAVPISYEPIMTTLSLIIAVLIVGLGLFIVSTGVTLGKILIAGTITGIGVASMHYIGMAAMVVQADIKWDTTIIIISVIIAVVASSVALMLAFSDLRGFMPKFISAIIMGLAVCGMHYTGMAAMSMKPSQTNIQVKSLIPPDTMAILLFVFSGALLVLSLVITISNRKKEASQTSEA